jgi:hypothetical protein
MKSRSFQQLVSVSALTAAALGLAACATQRNAADPNNPANIQTETASAELRSDRVRNWTVLDDQNLIVEAYDGTRYKAEMMGACQGLSFATRLGFSNRGGFKTIDRFSSVLLPDGQRCPLASFNKVITPEKSALDSYEKAEKEKEAADKETKDKEAKDKEAKDKEQKSEDSSAQASPSKPPGD